MISSYHVAEDAVCIQQNLTRLLDELPDNGTAKPMIDHMYGFLDDTNICDIESCEGARRQKAKLLKILMLKGMRSCNELFRVIEEELRRGDLIRTIRQKSSYLMERGNLFGYRVHFKIHLKTVNISLNIINVFGRD